MNKKLIIFNSIDLGNDFMSFTFIHIYTYIMYMNEV